MTPEMLFELSSGAVLLGWLALVLSPLARLWSLRVAIGVALMQSVLYVALILTYWSSAEGGYGSLPEVMALFDTPGIALAGWVHFLAFDLLVGTWITRTAADEGIAHALVLPCLALTFLFGPVGLLLFFALRAGFALRAQPQ